jgi:hypothetical protein
MNEVMKFRLSGTSLHGFGRMMEASCDVRNKANNRRRANEVVRTMPAGYPYQPMQFPVGKFLVTGVHERTQPDRAPYFIATTATRDVEVWELDKQGHYLQPSGIFVIDEGYGLHASIFKTTLGCIKIHKEVDVIWLVGMIRDTMEAGGKVWLEVTE